MSTISGCPYYYYCESLKDDGDPNMRPERAIRARRYDEKGDCRTCGRALGWGTLPPKTSLVYQGIERHCRRNAGVMPTQSELATAAGVSKPTMTEHFKILVKLGYLNSLGKGRYELLRYSAAEAIRKVEVECSSLQVQLDGMRQREVKGGQAAELVQGYEATIRKQVAMIEGLQSRLGEYEPDAREARRENTHQEIATRARQAAPTGTVAPGGPGALQDLEDIPPA